MDPHVAIATLLTVGIGYVMTQAGLQKSALELRRRRRICPSCGRTMESQVCRACADS